MIKQYDTIIIGGGQAGLAASYYLSQQRCNHIILEKQRIGEAWRSDKWDSFTLVTPNYMLQLPGFDYDGNEPFGFLHRDEVVQYLEDYVDEFDPNIQTGVEVTAVKAADNGDSFRLETSEGTFKANQVIIATGTFQQPNIPAFSNKVATHIKQLHSSEYRNPAELPEGAVLVVGSAQSGCQIADELNEHGRDVYLSTGKANRLPRRYRGHDSFWWAEKLGIMDQTVDQLPSREARFAPNPQVSGKDGGKTLSLQKLASEGVTLLGRMSDVNGTQVALDDDLKEHLEQADKFATEFKQGVDKYIKKNDLHAPEADQQSTQQNYNIETITQLDLDDADISTIIWATGYTYDYSWIDFPVFDDAGYPVTDRGVTEQPGLYFVGLHFLHDRKSGLLLGVGDDAAEVVTDIVEREVEVIT